MILWIGGAYGVGKSTLARALAAKMPGALLFDAEEVGNAVRKNYPDCPYGYIFEDYPLWAEFCFRLLQDIHTAFHRDILVPMTLVRRTSCDNILERLRQCGIETHFVILEASYQSIHDRILARGEEEDCWCMQNIEMARAALRALPGGVHMETDGKSVEQLAAQVLEMLQDGTAFRRASHPTPPPAAR